MIAVVDSGVANLRSVANAMRYLGADMHIAETPADLEGAEKIVLPGVGAFEAGMATLRKHDLIAPLRDKVAAGVPLLGICLGMQMLFECSEEMGEHPGLGLLPGRIVRFPNNGPKVPHIGWNQLRPQRKSPLLDDIPAGSYAYFVHSYYAQTSADHVLASADYGLDFPAVVGSENVFGAQFHPEKSQRTGLKLLKNFLEM